MTNAIYSIYIHMYISDKARNTTNRVSLKLVKKEIKKKEGYIPITKESRSEETKKEKRLVQSRRIVFE